MVVHAPVRLRDGRDIAAVLRSGRRRAGRYLVVHATAAEDPLAPAKVAVVASRRVGSAPARNRAKRLLREATRRVLWEPGVDVVLVARGACASSTLGPVQDEVVALASDLAIARSAA